MGSWSGNERTQPASLDDLVLVHAMQEDLANLAVPVFQAGGNVKEHLFLAFLDGTGMDKDNPRLGPSSTVAHLHDQLDRIPGRKPERVGISYSKGIGTQSNELLRNIDGALALTWDEGIISAYEKLAYQAEKWVEAAPDAQIRFVTVGYSRGAVQAAGLARLVDRFGIVSTEGLSFGRDEHGNISLESSGGVLVPPGQVPQASLLLDPVATNMPRNYDARLPPSVVSRVAVMAKHEQRVKFPHQAIVTTTSELGEDGVSLRLIAPGGHSNVGGGSDRAGLEILTGNLAVDYLNLLRDEPLFHKRALPQELEAYARYQKVGITGGFGLKMDNDDQRDERAELANCTIVEPCRASEPVDTALAQTLPHRRYQPDPFERVQTYELMTRIAERDVQALRQAESPAGPYQAVQLSPQPMPPPQPQPQPLLQSSRQCPEPADELTRLLQQDLRRCLENHDQLHQLSAERLLHAAGVARTLGYEPGGRWDAMIVGNHLHLAHASIHRCADRAALDLTQPVPALPWDDPPAARRQAEALQQEYQRQVSAVRVM